MRLFLVVLLAARAASAQPGKEVTREFQAGVDAYRLGKHDEARKHLERAKQLDPKLPGPNRFLAAVAQAQGRFEDCVAAARLAIELNPTSAELADTRKLHDDCRRSAGRPGYSAELGDKAAIGVTANVSGATVTISGLVYGATPLDPRPIPAGPHDVELTKAGYRSAKVSIHALPGIVTDVVAELAPDPGAEGNSDGGSKVVPPKEHDVTVIPFVALQRTAGAEMLVDGRRVTERRLEINDGGVTYMRGGFQVRLPAGDHVVELRVPEFDPWRRRVIVAAHAENEVTATLVETAPRERIRTRGQWLVGAGVGLAVVGGGLLYQSTRDDASVWKGLTATSFGLSAVTLSVGVWSLVRGQRPDLTAPPPMAMIPVAGGAVASTRLAF